ncbi:MAG: UDP-3-O-(3-hydroxymyristoyl)glucosamine N-acyltransferase, partial [Opitutales bacterium]
MEISFSAEQIIAIAAPEEQRGHTDRMITGIAPLSEAQEGDLTFLSGNRYRKQVPYSRASIVLLPPDSKETPRRNQLFLLCKNPSLVLTRICSRIENDLMKRPKPGIHPTAVVGKGCTVAAGASIGPLCVLEEGVTVGEGSVLQSNVFLGRGVTVGKDCWLLPHSAILLDCLVGDRVRLHPGVVIGSDGFGYESSAEGHRKIPQVGRVLIEDDVEIGANSTIDRARFSNTVIGEGTKIDNLVQIGHNVILGKHCILCAQVGIAGSTTIEDYVVLAGQVGVTGHVRVGRGCQVGAQSGIARSL